jgi:hypothetical protein
MENILEELKQFCIKEVTEKIILERQEYWNLIKNKKYLIIYYEYDYPNKIKLIQYAGKFSDKTPCYPGAYGDSFEGYYFYGINKKSDNYMETSYFITGEYNGNCFESKLSLRYKFFELENIFCEKIFLIFLVMLQKIMN